MSRQLSELRLPLLPYFTDLFSSRAPTLRQGASNCDPDAQNGAAGNLLSGC
ncbi:hypothetical protein ABZ958_32150 [Streptomyces sp. NPDC046237]|uniref:hypothetical protein n=1 Tax=Streptomyces sp. NPDC046237 TaxID=3154914 RepID=UPI0033D9F601